ncbi:MAG: T9SS type A sorting domain-containing protein, partial [Bacteroidia bacterium]|nr:T9SS type A sorting domain-containing protein [Bacteroidia bacterium]
MKFLFAFLFFCTCWYDTFSQVSTVKIMSWNLLNWPSVSNSASDSTTRCPYYREVVHYVEPDVLVTQENATTYSTTWFLDAVMNVNGPEYRQGTYIQGYDTNNGIFYRDSLFGFAGVDRIETPLRDISCFKLVFLPTGDTLRILSCHLKASSGSVNEQRRSEEVDSLRKFTNSFPDGTDFIVCGDFNIYGTFESAYQKLIQDDSGNDGNVVDPLNMSGTWNNPAYSMYHTQSSRGPSFGGGASGGLNDRFDMRLISHAVAEPTGIYYEPYSTTPVGNDGHHYNESVNAGTNTAVPAGVANALYFVSDHLPVFAYFDIGPTSGISELENDFSSARIYPNPAGSSFSLFLSMNKHVPVEINLYDISGKSILHQSYPVSNTGYFVESIDASTIADGLYFLHIQ